MGFKGSIGYLIHELAQQLTAESDQILLERFGIGFSQFKVLVAIEEQQGLQQKYIASLLGQTEASISRQIGILIDKDLVEIGPAKDSRQHLMYLTPRGEEMVQKASRALEIFFGPLLSQLSENQVTKLRDYLINIRSNINR
jgi:DNA-binding MarR family transcriptional regulator